MEIVENLNPSAFRAKREREKSLPFIPLVLLVDAERVRATLSKFRFPIGVWDGSDLAGEEPDTLGRVISLN